MQEHRWDEDDVLSGPADEEDLKRALADERNRAVSLPSARAGQQVRGFDGRDWIEVTPNIGGFVTVTIYEKRFDGEPPYQTSQVGLDWDDLAQLRDLLNDLLTRRADAQSKGRNPNE